MQGLLSLLPFIFCFWTGILIAWGAFTGYKNATIVHNVLSSGRKARRSDLIQLSVITIATSLLITALFILPQFVAYHLDTILFLEIWYSLFLLYITEHSFYVANSFKKNTTSHEAITHFHPKIN